MPRLVTMLMRRGRGADCALGDRRGYRLRLGFREPVVGSLRPKPGDTPAHLRSTGFSESEQAALARVSFLVQRHDRRKLDVVLSGFGEGDDFASVTPLFGTSTRWRSRTPFVLVRHPRRGKDMPVNQVIRELTVRGFAVPEKIIPVPGARLTDPHAGDSGLTRWVEFEVTRRGRSHPPGAFGFELLFRKPVRGPILLGYGCHYGLGQFEAIP